MLAKLLTAKAENAFDFLVDIPVLRGQHVLFSAVLVDGPKLG